MVPAVRPVSAFVDAPYRGQEPVLPHGAKDSGSADPDPLPPQHGPDLPVPLREERALLEHCSHLLQRLSIGGSGLRASLLEHAPPRRRPAPPLLRRPATTHRRGGIDTRAGRAKDRADHGERVAPIRRRAHHPSDLLSFLRSSVKPLVYWRQHPRAVVWKSAGTSLSPHEGFSSEKDCESSSSVLLSLMRPVSADLRPGCTGAGRGRFPTRDLSRGSGLCSTSGSTSARSGTKPHCSPTRMRSSGACAFAPTAPGSSVLPNVWVAWAPLILRSAWRPRASTGSRSTAGSWAGGSPSCSCSTRCKRKPSATPICAGARRTESMPSRSRG